MRDRLPTKIRRNECGVVNLDDNVGRGTHWTAYIKRGRNVKYFDSIGSLRPPLELINYFRSDGRLNTITYNSERYQSLNSYTCGHLCLKFLYTQSRMLT